MEVGRNGQTQLRQGPDASHPDIKRRAPAGEALCEVNPSNFSSLYGVPKRRFFPYPRLMAVTRAWPGTPRFARAPFASRRTCGRGAPACYSPRQHPAGMLTLPALQQLGRRSTSTKGPHPSLTRHWTLAPGHCFCNPFRMHVLRTAILLSPLE